MSTTTPTRAGKADGGGPSVRRHNGVSSRPHGADSSSRRRWVSPGVWDVRTLMMRCPTVRHTAACVPRLRTPSSISAPPRLAIYAGLMPDEWDRTDDEIDSWVTE